MGLVSEVSFFRFCEANEYGETPCLNRPTVVSSQSALDRGTSFTILNPNHSSSRRGQRFKTRVEIFSNIVASQS